MLDIDLEFKYAAQQIASSECGLSRRTDIVDLYTQFNKFSATQIIGEWRRNRLSVAHWVWYRLREGRRKPFKLGPYRQKLKMVIYCPQGSGTLRQQLLMMHWLCQSMPKHARECQSMPEYARLCQSITEYYRVKRRETEWNCTIHCMIINQCIINNCWRSVPLPCGQYMGIFFLWYDVEDILILRIETPGNTQGYLK